MANVDPVYMALAERLEQENQLLRAEVQRLLDLNQILKRLNVDLMNKWAVESKRWHLKTQLAKGLED